jgi:LysM repeat protein
LPHFPHITGNNSERDGFPAQAPSFAARAPLSGGQFMSMFDFVKEAGKKVGFGAGPPSAHELKAELDSHHIGAENVTVDVQGDKAVLAGTAPNLGALEKAVIAAGNAIGISKVEANVQVPPPVAATGQGDVPSKMYTVKKGDTLSGIAERVYGKGKGIEHRSIFEANQPMLQSPDKIYPGQVLRIPPIERKAA